MTQRLNIDIVARDKSKRALTTLQGSLGRLKQSIFNVRNAFLGIGAGFVIRNLINTGKEVENLQVRLKFLLKDTNEGAKAFDNMAKFASKVPFSLEEISRGSGILATVTDNADDLQNMLEITGNVAAVTGLDFRTAAEQIQRSFSAGIGAADLFREKGVRNMLGFKAGATVSIEETVKAFERVFSKGGRFGSATDELAKTFEGTLSMIGDKVFNFKRVLLEAGFFKELKNQFGDLNEFLEKNGKQVDIIAKKIGKGLAIAFKGLANTVIFVKNNINKFALALGALISLKVATFFYGIVTALNSLTVAMYAFNLATRRNIIFGSIMVFATAMGFLIKKFKEFKGELNKQEETIESLNAKIVKWQKIVDSTSTRISQNKKNEAKLNIKIAEEKIRLLKLERDEVNMLATAHMRVTSTVKKANDEFKEAFKANQISESHDAMHKMMNETQKLSNIQTEVWQKIKDQNAQWSLSNEIVSAVNTGVQGFSRMLAESVVYGKKINASFRELAKGLLVDILAKMIERIALVMIEEFILSKIIKKDKDKLAMEKNITKEKKKQVFYQALLMMMGGGGGGGSAMPGGKATGGAVSKGNAVVVGERGPELFVPNSTGQITQNARGTGGGSVVVNFNVNTIDSRGFDEALYQNRGTITAIINNAVNEKGRRELI